MSSTPCVFFQVQSPAVEATEAVVTSWSTSARRPMILERCYFLLRSVTVMLFVSRPIFLPGSEGSVMYTDNW